MVASFESVSTWRPDAVPPPSPARAALLAGCAAAVAARSPQRLRVCVDGRTGSGKTTFGRELAAVLRAGGRSTATAGLDDFKHPWRHAREHGYDRLSGAGYYRNPWDVAAVRGLLLGPAGPDGSGRVALCAHDPLTGADHRGAVVALPAGTVLVVDGVFTMRPEYDDLWDLRIWLDVPAEVAMARGIDRDRDREGEAEAERLHRDRYAAAERLYLAEVDPRARADLVIDNTRPQEPVRVR